MSLEKKYKYYSHEPAGLRKMKTIENWLKLKKKKELSILDVGCGLGHLSAFMANLGHQVKAIDLDEPSIKEAKQLYSKERIDFFDQDLVNQSGKYDAITAFEVCEHVEKLPIFLKTIGERLEDKGKLIISVPNGFSPEEIIRRFLQHTRLGKKIKALLRRSKILPKSDSQSYADSPHVHFWGFGRWKKEIEKAGFVLEKKKNVSFIFKQLYYLGLRKILRPGRIFRFFDAIDTGVVSVLPYFLSDGWIMIFRKK